MQSHREEHFPVVWLSRPSHLCLLADDLLHIDVAWLLVFLSIDVVLVSFFSDVLVLAVVQLLLLLIYLAKLLLLPFIFA